jgi:hypothetical protein
MPSVPLTTDQIELLLVLCQINRDIFSYARVRDEPSAVRKQKLAAELELTKATIKALEEAR